MRNLFNDMSDMSISSISNYTLNTYVHNICVCILIYIYVLHLYFYTSRNPSKPICLDPRGAPFWTDPGGRAQDVGEVNSEGSWMLPLRGHPSHGWVPPIPIGSMYGIYIYMLTFGVY